MRIGIGLPNPVPGASGATVLAWARRAEERGFAGLSTIDRLVYPTFDSLTTLAAVAGATGRIRLASNILLAPLYPPVLLAKTAASIDQLSGGRFTLGMSAGSRADDYAAAGRDFHTRGRDFDAALDLMHRAWRGEPVVGGESAVCPTPVDNDRVPVLIGGSGEHALRRIASWGAGWTAGGSGPDRAGPMFEQVRTAWAQAGRQGEPRLAALVYFSLGAEAEPESRGYLRDYYAFTGDYAEMIAGSAFRTPAAVKEVATIFADLGCTELYFDPTSLRMDQIDRLADAVL